MSDSMRQRAKDGYHYSGDGSQTFWARVNALPEPDLSALYTAGVILQDVEEYVLGQLRYAELQARRTAAKGAK